MEKKNGGDPSRNLGRNMPPPVYRPIPTASQRKTVSPAAPARSGAPAVYRPLTETPQAKSGSSLAAPVRPAVPPPYRPFASTSQLKPSGAPPVYRPSPTQAIKSGPAAVRRSAPAQMSSSLRVGSNAYRITAGGGVGSVMVDERDRRSIEITDLKVNAQYRKQGFGGALMASALREGLRMGKTEVFLASQDDGRGSLTRWYSGMGFSQIGRTVQGYPKMFASIGRLLSTIAQRTIAAHAPARVVQPKFAPAPVMPRHISSLVIQRMERRCKWCVNYGCINGSICGSTSTNVGTYSARTQDQEHLSSMYGQDVSGKTHQMEHPFGYKVLAGPMHLQGQRASTPATRRIEQDAPAYHEEFSQHRKHEGTGSGKAPRESGLGGDEYRNWQRTALEEHNLDIAIAINQMTYANQTLPRDPIARQQSNDSYGRMVRNMGPVPLGTAGGVTHIPAPTDDQKFDMLVFRFQADHHRDPSYDEQLAIIAQYGLRPSWF